MNVSVKHSPFMKQRTPCLVVALPEGKTLPSRLKELDSLLGGALALALREREFCGKSGESLLLHGGGRLAPQRVLLVGLGPVGKVKGEQLRRAAGGAVSLLQGRRIEHCAVAVETFQVNGLTAVEAASALAEGGGLAAYRFDAWRGESSRELPPLMAEMALLLGSKAELAAAGAAVARAAVVVAAVHLARDLVNTPGNAKSPAQLAEQAATVAAACGLGCTVLDRAALEAEQMGALLGVAQGSMREPRLVVLEYRGGAADAAPVVLVGKGVVFDAGGISLKPAEKMDEMKMDMAGAAAVLATLQAVAGLRLAVNVVGILPLVENLPSGSAYRPGDILTASCGKTVEILNTDAEGRLILADALTYARRFKPKAVVDLATLTGACIIALGCAASAVLGSHQPLVRQLIASGEACGERLWQLPLWDDYAALVKSEVADLKNSGGRPAGTITAAAFLHAFTADLHWAHLDIAGTAWEEKGRPYVPKGGSGVGVRLLVDWLSRHG